MGAAFNDVAVLHHKDLVGIFYGGKPMRHNKAGSTFHQFLKSVLHKDLGAGIYAGGRLVQNQNRRAAQHYAGNAQQLALPLADVAAVLGNDGVVPVGQTADKAVGAGFFGGCDNFLPACIGLAVGDVFRHGAGFQPRFLQDHTQVGTQAVAGHGVNGMSVHAQAAAANLIKAHQQVDQRCLAAAGGSHQGNALPGLYRQVHILDQRHVGQIAELDVFKRHGTGAMLQRVSIGGIGQDRRFVNQIKHALGARHGVLQLGHNAGNIIKGLGILVGVIQKDRQLTHGNAAANGRKRAQNPHRRIHQRVDKPGAGVGHGGVEHRADAAFLQRLVDDIKAGFGAALVPEGAHQLLVADQFLHKPGHLGAGFALQLEHRVGVRGNVACHKDGKRRQRHDHQRNAPVDPKHHTQGAGNG